MKKINKTQGANQLTRFSDNNPNASWQDFRDHNAGNDYKTTRKLALSDQGGICAYCESKLGHLPEHKQRIEHYHSKSDSTGTTNWALDWQNIFVVCIGGSDTDKGIHPLPANLSCDAHKDHLIQDNKLAKACEGYYLNPLELIATPCLFVFDKATGKIMPDQNACNNWQAPENHYTSTYDLVEKTIEILNLDCQRLLDDRLEVLKRYNQEIKKARMTGDKQILSKLAQRWFQKKWPGFFTTQRLLLGNHAENYLSQIAYKG